MKTKNQVFDLAKKLNVDIQHDDFDITWTTDCWAPTGFILLSTDCHCAVTSEFQVGQDKREHWQAVYNDLIGGLEPCSIKDCDTCGK